VNVLAHTIVSDARAPPHSLHQNRRDQMSRALEIEANSTQSEETSSSSTESNQGSYCSFKEQCASQVLLATATVKVTDSQDVQ